MARGFFYKKKEEKKRKTKRPPRRWPTLDASRQLTANVFILQRQKERQEDEKKNTETNDKK